MSSAVSLASAPDGGARSTPRPGRLTPWERDPVHIVQEVLLSPGPVWTGAENLPPPQPGFEPRTVQPVASRYTDWAIPAHTHKT